MNKFNTMPKSHQPPTTKRPPMYRQGIMTGSGPERGIHYRLMDARAKKMLPPPPPPAAPSDQLYGGRAGKRRGGAVDPIPQAPQNKMARIMDFLSK